MCNPIKINFNNITSILTTSMWYFKSKSSDYYPPINYFSLRFNSFINLTAGSALLAVQFCKHSATRFYGFPRTSYLTNHANMAVAIAPKSGITTNTKVGRLSISDSTSTSERLPEEREFWLRKFDSILALMCTLVIVCNEYFDNSFYRWLFFIYLTIVCS